MSATENRLGLNFYFDTNFVGDPSEAAIELRALDSEGWIELMRTDTVDTELGNAKDSTKRTALLHQSAGYVESLGPFMFGSSRFGAAVFGNEDDQRRFQKVFGILFPDSDHHDPSTGRAPRKVRDANHIVTAIRYGCDGFITLDERDLLSKSEAIAGAFDGFRIMSPETALAFVQRMRDRYDRRHR